MFNKISFSFSRDFISLLLFLSITFCSTVNTSQADGFRDDLRTSWREGGLCGATWKCLQAPVYAIRSCGVSCPNPFADGNIFDLSDARTWLTFLNLTGIGFSIAVDAMLAQAIDASDHNASISDISSAVDSLYVINNIDKARMIAIIALLTIDKLKGKKINYAIAKTTTSIIDGVWNFTVDGVIKHTLKCLFGRNCISENDDWSISLRDFDDEPESETNEMSKGAAINQLTSTILSTFSLITKSIIFEYGIKPGFNDLTKSKIFSTSLAIIGALVNIDSLALTCYLEKISED